MYEEKMKKCEVETIIELKVSLREMMFYVQKLKLDRSPVRLLVQYLLVFA